MHRHGTFSGSVLKPMTAANMRVKSIVHKSAICYELLLPLCLVLNSSLQFKTLCPRAVQQHCCIFNFLIPIMHLPIRNYTYVLMFPQHASALFILAHLCSLAHVPTPSTPKVHIPSWKSSWLWNAGVCPRGLLSLWLICKILNRARLCTVITLHA